MAAAGPVLWLPTTQAGWGNNPNLSQREVVIILTVHPFSLIVASADARSALSTPLTSATKRNPS